MTYPREELFGVISKRDKLYSLLYITNNAKIVSELFERRIYCEGKIIS